MEQTRTFFVPRRTDFIPNFEFEFNITKKRMIPIEQRWIGHNQF